VEKFLRIVVIKEIKGSQYGVQLESAVRDRLAADDKYEEEEEAALEKLVEFFQSAYFKKNSIITYHFPATSATAEVNFHLTNISSFRHIMLIRVAIRILLSIRVMLRHKYKTK
jgi:mRNA-degrading endonuclease HigB of HigAB toxin-antitoxin module